MNRLTTVWGEQLKPEAVLQEYPRPQLRRESYINLNGYWECVITKASEATEPAVWDRHILVPFCPESELSGIGHVLLPDEVLWYRRTFMTEAGFNPQKSRLILHFGAVDREATVLINGNEAGTHIGGYIPFSLDITELVHDGENVLTVKVSDTTEEEPYARGKQKLEPGGMFYTPVSGIWQTVWLETVPRNYIETLKITPMFDDGRIVFEAFMSDGECGLELKVFDGSESVAAGQTAKGSTISVQIPQFTAWSPENPFLYDYEIKAGADIVKGYFAMRKLSVGRDENQIPRLMLNNRPYFQNGLLDQGYWPDGLYTAPSDEALYYDIEQCKRMGFNMLRKHAKIEPLRWYYHCDRIGMLVWQDIVNGGEQLNSYYVTYRPTVFPFIQTRTRDIGNRRLSRNSAESREIYRKELKDTVELLYNSPSIVLWTLFNEGWGQFESEAITALARQLDSTRFIDSASGWFDRGAGDVRSLHIYFTSFTFDVSDRPLVLSEFGGYSLPTPEHVACDKVYGYRKFTDRAAYTAAYENLYRRKIIPGIAKGLCAAVYTQVSDIEEEINGLLTYDRKVVKIDCEAVHRININMCYSD